jgi:hypothetical protein
MLSQNINRVSDGRWWQLDWMCSSSSTYAEVPDNCDRPIGSRAGLGRGTSRFIPNAIVLTSAVVRALQTENPPGLIRLDYRDVGPAGDYSLFLRVRIDRTVEPETDSLGRVWEVRENGWVGTWTRRGNSKTFDAEWTAPNGQRIRDTIIIEDIQGRDIVLRRVGLNGYYKGTITPEGKRAIGTATWYPAGASWSAYIVP